MNIKIGNRNYTVHFDEFDDCKVDGCIDYTQSKITINSSISKDYQQETLLHEVLHGMIDDSKMQMFFTDDMIEKFVSCVSPRLIQVINDNKELINFLAR